MVKILERPLWRAGEGTEQKRSDGHQRQPQGRLRPHCVRGRHDTVKKGGYG